MKYKALCSTSLWIELQTIKQLSCIQNWLLTNRISHDSCCNYQPFDFHIILFGVCNKDDMELAPLANLPSAVYVNKLNQMVFVVSLLAESVRPWPLCGWHFSDLVFWLYSSSFSPRTGLKTVTPLYPLSNLLHPALCPGRLAPMECKRLWLPFGPQMGGTCRRSQDRRGNLRYLFSWFPACWVIGWQLSYTRLLAGGPLLLSLFPCSSSLVFLPNTHNANHEKKKPKTIKF